MTQVIALVFIVIALYYVVQVIRGFLPASKPANACPRCDGQGYWLGTRDRERCNWCKGTGKLPPQ